MLNKIVKERTLLSLNMTEEELDQLINEDESVLHDPFLYADMDKLVRLLHEFKLQQLQNPHLLLVVDTDYDTDGVMSASVVSAALDVFNINHRVYIPSMDDGYGLSPKAVDDMLSMYEIGGYKVTTILTADNGTNAVDGVAYAKEKGISVLVTDHHLGGEDYADADVIVNPNRIMPDGTVEPYPFKGNAGATVAWKAMLAYATTYRPDAYDLIFDLVVFAGIANVADVMPIVDENHYMVKLATQEFQRLVNIRNLYGNSDFAYDDIKSTIYPHYNTVFHGLYDLMTLLQESKDEVRAQQGKKPIALPQDEELISWYLSPMINAPRRIHATSREAMLSFMATTLKTRHENIQTMIHMNNEKSDLRNDVLVEIKEHHLGEHSNVLFVNTKHGISGLIAGQVAERTRNATIVFAYPSSATHKIYNSHDFDARLDAADFVISGSARSTEMQPLNLIVERIVAERPEIVVGGGGHAAAAGYAIRYCYLDEFKILFDKYAEEIRDEMRELQRTLIQKGDIEPVPENVVRLTFHDRVNTSDYAPYNVVGKTNLMNELMEVMSFQKSLKPFGKDFNGQTKFIIEIDLAEIQKPEYNLDLKFWKTLKFFINGVTVLTFKEDVADLIKSNLSSGNNIVMSFMAELKPNEFNGRVTPQLIINDFIQ